MVTGSIPPGSGLSSSAALIVASLLSILKGNSLIPEATSPGNDQAPLVSNADLVQLAREAEGKIGVNSGGMDQSASILAQPGASLYVSFAPQLQVESVNLPSVTVDGKEEKLVMVIANSLATHDLAGGAKKQYNLRVVETLIGARVLGQALGLFDDADNDPANPRRPQLREIVARFGGEPSPASKDGLDLDNSLTTDALESALTSILEKLDSILGSTDAHRAQGHTVEELVTMSGMDPDVFKKTYLDFIEVDTSDQGDRFRIYMRVKHVFSEALKVLQVRRICRDSSTSGDVNKGKSDVETIGRLMDQSHQSCKELYECSNEELDELQQLCKKAGSVGSRLSG